MRGNVLIGLGANLPGPWGTPLEALRRAVRELDRGGTRLTALSPIYRSAPIGQPGQPAYVNAVAEIATHLPPQALLRKLKQMEAQAGRRGRAAPWGARCLDLDILDYRGLIAGWRGKNAQMPGAGTRVLSLPHPQMHLRPFVLVPLADIAPQWRHPIYRQSAEALLKALGWDSGAAGLEPLDDGKS